MPSIKPPDYRAAQGIQGFTEGLQSGLNIVQDVGRIKALKGENERRDIQTKRDADADARSKVTEGREDEEYGQRQEDRANSKRDEIVAKQEKFMTGYARAIRNDPAIATDIRNMMFTAIGNPKRVTATQARDVDGGFEIVETYEDGTTKTIDADYVKQAFNGFPRPRSETVDGEEGDGITPSTKLRTATALMEAKTREIERAKDTATPEELDALYGELTDLQRQVKELSGLKPVGISDKPPAPITPVARPGSGITPTNASDQMANEVLPSVPKTSAAQPPSAPPADQRVKGTVYTTPKGPLKWTGTGWIAPNA